MPLLHKAVVHQPFAVAIVLVAVSNQIFAMMFEGCLEQPDALVLLYPGRLPTAFPGRRWTVTFDLTEVTLLH